MFLGSGWGQGKGQGVCYFSVCGFDEACRYGNCWLVIVTFCLVGVFYKWVIFLYLNIGVALERWEVFDLMSQRRGFGCC